MPKRNNRNRTKRGSNSRGSRNNRLLNSVVQRMNGLRLRPNPDPSSFTATPWNSLTLGVFWTSTSDSGYQRALLTSNSIGPDIKAQLGFSTPTALLQFRIRSVRAWCDNTEVNQGPQFEFFNMDVVDFIAADVQTDNNAAILTSINDTTGKNHFATVGYKYPKAHFEYVLAENAPDSKLLIAFDYPRLSTVFAYIDLLWRFQPPQSTVPEVAVHGLIRTNKPSQPLQEQSSYDVAV